MYVAGQREILWRLIPLLMGYQEDDSITILFLKDHKKGMFHV